MKVVIAGAGSVGRSVAKELTHAGHDITIVDKQPSAMKIASVPEADWILADACEPETLQRAQAGEADVVVAATGDDKANLVISLLSKTEYGVERVIARVNDPADEWLFDDSWGVDVAISTPRVMAPFVEDALSNGRLVTVMRFYRSGAALLQTTLPAHAPLVGMAVSDVVLPPSVVLNAIVRDGVPFTADPDLTIEAEDQVLFLYVDGEGDDLDIVRELIGDESLKDGDGGGDVAAGGPAHAVAQDHQVRSGVAGVLVRGPHEPDRAACGVAEGGCHGRSSSVVWPILTGTPMGSSTVPWTG